MKQNTITLLLFFLVITCFWGCNKSKRPSLNPALTQEFFKAVDDNNQDDIIALLQKEPKLVFARDDLGFTPLMKAARYGKSEIVEILLRNKSEVNAQADMGETALFRTMDVNKYKNAELLLKYGADPNLKENSQDWAALPCACYYGNLRMAKLLLANGADVNVTGKYDQTPLHWSMRAITWDNQKEIVQLLLDNGVNASHEDSNGRTALQMAERRSADGVVELLRSHGTNY